MRHAVRTAIIAATVAATGMGTILAHEAGPVATRVETLCAGKPPAASFKDLLCCFAPATDPQHCLDDRVTPLVGSGTRAAIDALEAETAGEPLLDRKCHPIVHAIGRTSFALSGNFGQSFHGCDHRCQAGCYHGVIERMFFTQRERDLGINHLTLDELRDRIPTVCAPENLNNPTRELLIQCTHGLGHAILYSLEYRLDEALEGCGLLQDDIGRQSCEIGVFMENVVTGELEKRDLKEGEPLYPCTRLPERYLRSCYRQQTKVMIHMNLSYAEIAGHCRAAGPYADVCFEGLGRDTSAEFRTGDLAVPRICEEHAGEYLDACTGGAVKALIDFTWDARHAFKYCAALTSEPAREHCFATAGEHMRWAYHNADGGIGSQCAALQDEAAAETCASFAPRPWWQRLLSLLMS